MNDDLTLLEQACASLEDAFRALRMTSAATRTTSRASHAAIGMDQASREIYHLIDDIKRRIQG